MKASVLISCWSTLLLMSMDASTGQSQTETCVGEEQLIFYHSERKTFANAQKACKNFGASLVKVDSARVTEAINGQRRFGNVYYIGGKWSGTSFRWVKDQSTFRYTNWYPDEPDGWDENCLVIGWNSRSRWSDVRCDNLHRYICCKKHPLALSLSNTTRVGNTTKINCSLTSPCRNGNLSWYGPTGKISENDTSGIYQVTLNGSYELNFVRFTIQDVGNYTCKVTDGDETTEKSVSKNVSATPTIHKVLPTACSQEVKVFWNAHGAAVNFEHRIKVYATKASDKRLVLSDWPPNSTVRETSIRNLLNSATYQIQIQACKNPCNEDYVTEWIDITTGGIPNPPNMPNSRLYSGYLGSICFVEWTPPSVIGDPIVAYQVTAEGIANARNGTEIDVFKMAYNATDTFCAFNLPPRRNYTILVQSVTCGGLSSATQAAGSCNTPDYAVATTAATTTGTASAPIGEVENAFVFGPDSFLIGTFVSLLIAAIALLIWCLFQRNRRKTTADPSGDSPSLNQDEVIRYGRILGLSEDDVGNTSGVDVSVYCDIQSNEDSQTKEHIEGTYEIAQDKKEESVDLKHLSTNV